MRILLNRKELENAIKRVSGSIGNDRNLPILECIKFDVKGGIARLTSTNLNVTTETEIEVKGKDMDFCVSGKMIGDIVKSLSDDTLTITLDQNIEISSGTGRYSIPVHDISDFPKLPEFKGTEVDLVGVYKGLDLALKSTSKDELRPAMTGVCISFGTRLDIVGTDAHILSKFSYDLSSKEAVIVVPQLAIKALLAVYDTTVKVEYDSKNVKFNVGNTTIIARLIEHRYPNYDAVIPQDNSNIITADRRALLGAVKRILTVSSDFTNKVVLDIKNDKLTVIGEDTEHSRSGSEDVDIEYKGDDIKIGFNGRYLGTVLSELADEKIQFRLGTPNRAGIFKGQDYEVLVMPVSV